MPGRASRRGSRRAAKDSSDDDDDVIGGRSSSPFKARTSPLVSPRILNAAKKSQMRQRRKEEEAAAAAEKGELASSSRSARRERRKSQRRGSVKKSTPGEGKVDAAELDARARRREARRNKRTPRGDSSARTGFFAEGSPTSAGGFSSTQSPSASRGRTDAPEMTEVEVIAWQHQIKKKAGDDSDENDSSDGDLNAVIDHSDDENHPAPKRHPKSSGGAWGSRQQVPDDSDSTAGVKSRPTSGKRRELSPVNVRRRVGEKVQEKQKRNSLRDGAGSDDDNNNKDSDGGGGRGGRRSGRAARTRNGRRGSARKPVAAESESSESSDDDTEEVTGRRRRGSTRRGRAAAKSNPLTIEKPSRRKGRRGTDDEPSTPGTPSDAILHAKTLHRTSHETRLVDGQETPSGHKKLTRTSPKTDTPNSHGSPGVHEQLKQQLEADGLKGRRGGRAKKQHEPEGKGGDSSGSDSDSSGSRHRRKNNKQSPTRRSPTRSPKKNKRRGSSNSEDSGSDGSGGDPDETPGEKGREVFKGAFSGGLKSPKRNGDGDAGGGGAAADASDDDLGGNDTTPYALAASSNWAQRRAFLTSPVPLKAGILQCKVVRSKKKDGFVMWLETVQSGRGKQVEFLMAGKQRKGAKATLNCVISMDESDHSRHGKGCIGKLRANMRTTEYILFDEGLNPTLAGNRRKAASPSNKTQLREELCFMTFVKGQMGFARGPREITSYVPFVNRKSLDTLRCRPIREEDGLKSWVLQHASDEPNLKTYKLINKPPVWNEQVRKYILNFNGRVEVASVKNFQLVLERDQETLVLQCGRGHDSEDGSSCFILDFGWPLSPIQAFAIGLAGMTA